MELGFKGKETLVMASSSELGKAIALGLYRGDTKVMLFSPFEEQLRETQVETAKETDNQPEFFTGSIINTRDIKNLVQTTVEKCGPTFALVNNTGDPEPDVLDVFSDQGWQDIYELRLPSHIRTIHAILPFVRQNGGGRILCSTSSSVKAVLDNLIPSNTFRMGVMGLAKTLSQKLGKDRTLVNVIGPGRIGTDRIDWLDAIRVQRRGVTVEEVQQKTYQTIPMGRYGKPEGYGKFVAFLCSEANIFITGQAVPVDGGMVKAF